MVHRAAGPHRGLLQRPQPGRRLAGVPHPQPGPAASTNARVLVAMPREVAEEVERGALGGEDRCQRPGDRGRAPSPASTSVAVGHQPGARRCAASTWRKVSSTHARAGDHAGGAGHELGLAVAPAGSRADVRSPSGVRSSSRARRPRRARHRSADREPSVQPATSVRSLATCWSRRRRREQRQPSPRASCLSAVSTLTAEATHEAAQRLLERPVDLHDVVVGGGEHRPGPARRTSW